jgi:hypothetical protein
LYLKLGNFSSYSRCVFSKWITNGKRKVKWRKVNEAPHRKRWGIKRNYGIANPASLYRASPWFASPFIPAAPHKTAGSPLRYDKPQGILAKPNKRTEKVSS